MKTVGEHRAWDEAYWAYCVDDNGKAVIVGCKTRQDAEWEKDRMKMGNNFRRVGFTTQKIEELTMRKKCKTEGWKVILIRYQD